MSAPGVWRAPQQPADARERLLREIVARVPVERIAEIHLFPPMRQGGVEMGVAVIAAEPEPAMSGSAADAGTTADGAPAPADVVDPHGVADAAARESAAMLDAAAPDADAGIAPDGAAPDGAAPDGAAPDGAASRPGPTSDEPAVTAVDADADAVRLSAAAATARADRATVDAEASPTAMAGRPDEPEGRTDDAGVAACDPTDAAAGPPPDGNDGAADSDARDPNVAAGVDRTPEPVATRYTVLTARYRLTLKGPDRGRWEADVTVEADAPLLTVDAVVRGVQRRAGDGVAPERLDAAALAAALAPLRGPAPGAPVP